MSVEPAETPPPPLRGECNPTEQMESFQRGYLETIIAVAGCILFEAKVDDGIDAIIKHRSAEHQNDVDCWLQIQLKSTGLSMPGPGGTVKAQFRKDRYDLFAAPTPTIPKIVVIMIQPPAVEDWISASHQNLEMRHCSYWVNIAGQTSQSKRPYVHAPRANIFDDRALCAIMARVGRGGAP